jgi:hypothetical protein
MPPLTAKNIGFPGVSSPVRLRRGLDQSESVWFPDGLEPEKEILLSRLINMPVSATCGSSWRIRLQDQRRRRRYVAFWKFQLPDDIVQERGYPQITEQGENAGRESPSPAQHGCRSNKKAQLVLDRLQSISCLW